MFEKNNIQSRGFQNVYEGDKVVGFQIPIRSTYYRGVWLSMLRPAKITVDGEKYDGEQITWTINNKIFEQAELKNYPNENWNIQDLAILTVRKPNGLKYGLHNVEVFYTYSASYLPPRLDTMFGETFKRTMVLVK